MEKLWRFVVASLVILLLVLAFGKSKPVSAQQPTQFEYQTVLATECNVPSGFDVCAVGGTFTGPVKDVLTNLSSQGFDLYVVTPLDPGSQGAGTKVIVYTLRRPVVV